jgi:hypothetical protein
MRFIPLKIDGLLLQNLTVKFGLLFIPGEKIRFVSFPSEGQGGRRESYMKKKRLAESAAEFDRRFDAGEDIHELIDVSKAEIVRHGKKVRITIDMSETLVDEIDEIRRKIGVDRGALIKVWLHERVKQEKAATGSAR